MRFYSYLNEQSIDESNYLEVIEKKCHPFIDDIRSANGYLYTGRNSSKLIINRNVRKDRRPKDTPTLIHNISDKYFMEKFGVKARSSTIFCTGNMWTAADYGHPYIIFPVGKYEIIWSTKVKDFTTYVTSEKNFKKYAKKYKKVGTEEERDKQLNKFIEDTIDRYKTGNLKKAVKSENEVMLVCDEYIGVSYKKEDEVNEYFSW